MRANVLLHEVMALRAAEIDHQAHWRATRQIAVYVVVSLHQKQAHQESHAMQPPSQKCYFPKGSAIVQHGMFSNIALTHVQKSNQRHLCSAG